MRRGNSANDILYSSASTRTVNMSVEAAIDEFQPSDRLSKFDAPKTVSYSHLLFQTSMADAQYLQVSQVSQPQHGNLLIMDSFWSQPQSSCQAKQQITVSPQLSAIEIPRLLATSMPTSQAPESPKLPQKVNERRKRLSPQHHASTSGSTSPKPSPHGGRAKSRKLRHSVIEKRYRSNLSEKIALLRDSIPSLRNMDKDVPTCNTAMEGNLRSSEATRNLKKVGSS